MTESSRNPPTIERERSTSNIPGADHRRSRTSAAAPWEPTASARRLDEVGPEFQPGVRQKAVAAMNADMRSVIRQFIASRQIHEEVSNDAML
jgi:hypothetical protein